MTKHVAQKVSDGTKEGQGQKQGPKRQLHDKNHWINISTHNFFTWKKHRRRRRVGGLWLVAPRALWPAAQKPRSEDLSETGRDWESREVRWTTFRQILFTWELDKWTGRQVYSHSKTHWAAELSLAQVAIKRITISKASGFRRVSRQKKKKTQQLKRPEEHIKQLFLERLSEIQFPTIHFENIISMENLKRSKRFGKHILTSNSLDICTKNTCARRAFSVRRVPTWNSRLSWEKTRETSTTRYIWCPTPTRRRWL